MALAAISSLSLQPYVARAEPLGLQAPAPIRQAHQLSSTALSALPQQETNDSLTGIGLHIIEPGDTLFSLARRYGTRVDALANQNVMRVGAILIPGRVLRFPLAVPSNALDFSSSPASDTDPRRSEGGPSRVVQASSAAPAFSSASADEHHVIPGETLFGIAGRYGVSVDDLQRWNGLDDSGGVQAGATLTIGPRDSTNAEADALEIAAPVAPIPANIAQEPAQAAPYRPAPDGGTDFIHVVSAAETLSSIARLYGETTISLERLNGLGSDIVYVGQQISVPATGLGPDAAPSFGTKRVVMDISEQRMYVWRGDTLVWNMVASSGIAGFTTRRGTFAIQSKIPNAWSGPWQLWMPYWMGIYWAGGSENGIQALPITKGQRLWAGYLGSPISYGCIVLSTEDALRLYNWVEMGTEVVIRD